MTLTLSALLSAPALYLHLEGDAKRRVFDAAVADPCSALPVRTLLAQAPVPTRLFWCPTTRPMLVTKAGAAVGAR